MIPLVTTWTESDFRTWIIKEEEDWLAINKPAGVPTAPSQHHPMDLGRWVRTIWPEGALPHRLDRLTSGLLIVAKTKKGNRIWSRLFSEGDIRKEYLALVFGQVKEKGFIDIKIDPQLAHGKVKLFKGKSAKTRFYLLGYDAQRDVSLVLGEPLTGRTHQIRAHFWGIDHALLGDNIYRSKTAKPAWASDLERPWLHAYRLRATIQGSRVQLEAPVGEDLLSYLSPGLVEKIPAGRLGAKAPSADSK